MLIKDVCKKSKLTKKAVEYYEKQGLIMPSIGDNGYRNYNENDLNTLKEIAVLRKLGFGITDIKSIIRSSNKSASLSKYKYILELKMQRTKEQNKRLESLINNYDINREFELGWSSIEELYTPKEKLIQAFPGTYGIYLCIHFGRFLDEQIDSKEKEEAYYEIIKFLDNIDIPKELEEHIESYFLPTDKEDIENLDTGIIEAIGDIETYIDNNKEVLESYLQYRLSDEFMATDGYKMQQLILGFQRKNGYMDIFIPNLKILSKSYREYAKKLELVNEILINKYPKVKDLY